ncbi:hypothetical protein [Streptomyces hirsutus]|uniref:hypothetical protein n=1 Tax=Streptomyces hirsutus TaxID=35620 RepID=UPI0036AAB604
MGKAVDDRQDRDDTTEQAKHADHRLAVNTISDPGSFRDATGDGHEIAGLYLMRELDILIDLAHAVATDFFARPQRYKEVDTQELAKRIARLHARYGNDERFLSYEQRRALFAPLFADRDGDFTRYRDGLLAAAATYSEWGQATGLAMQRAAVRSAHTSLKVHLSRFSGASLSWSRHEALPYLTEEICYPILRDRGVTSVFGVYRPPGEAWPYREDAEGGELVEEICRRLLPSRQPQLTRHAFSLRQRLALRGAEAIAAVLDYAPHDDDERELDVLITKCYTWHTALRDAASSDTAASASVAPAPPTSSALLNGVPRETPAL